MFTTGMPKIYQVMEYVLVLAAVLVIWQAVTARPTKAQDDGERDDLRGLLVDLNEQALEEGYPTFSMIVDPPIFDRTRITPTEDNINITSIGEDYVCLAEEWETLTNNYCVPLSAIKIVSLWVG